MQTYATIATCINYSIIYLFKKETVEIYAILHQTNKVLYILDAHRPTHHIRPA